MTLRTALVTGAGSGLGARIASCLSDDGYAVAVNDVDAERAEQTASQIVAAGGTASAFVGDVADEGAVDDVITSVREQLGPVYVLVNNAGVADQLRDTVDQDVAAWQKVIDINLRGVYICSRRAIKDMTDAGTRGVIVNIASVLGLRGAPRRTAYGPSKAAVINLTQTLAVECAAQGIRVNAIAPGYMRTPALQTLIDQGTIHVGELEARVPMGGLGGPDDVAHAASYLVSEGARYVTGTTLVVDGGLTAWLAV